MCVPNRGDAGRAHRPILTGRGRKEGSRGGTRGMHGERSEGREKGRAAALLLRPKTVFRLK